MNQQIKSAIEKGRLVLLFGAGASMTSLDKHGKELLPGGDLAKFLAEEAGFEYADEQLQVVYSAVQKPLGGSLESLLEDKYKHCRPSVVGQFGF